MEEITNAVKQLNLDSSDEDYVPYEYISVFKNPNNLPINQIYLEKSSVELRKDINLNEIKFGDDRVETCYELKNYTIPALDKSWLPSSQQFYNFFPYNFTQSKEENARNFTKNWKFIDSLNFLLSCDYHQFWCSVLFDPKVGAGLHSFILNPILPHQLDDVDDEIASLYLSVLSEFLAVFERLINFKESKIEYMSESTLLQLLLEKKLINLPIVATLCLLYQDLNQNFVNNLVDLYFGVPSLFRDKEVEEMLDHIIMSFEMVGGHVCGFEKNAVIIPIAIEQRPLVFDLHWVYSVVNYIVNTINTLYIMLKFHKPVIEIALDKKIPYRLTFTYEKVFFSLYDSLLERKELEVDARLGEIIYNEIALARRTFIDVYNTFVMYSLDKALGYGGDAISQQDFIEIYIKLLQDALEDEYFICDYHEIYDIGVQNEMFASCTEIDTTRTDYIVNCITALRRHSRIWKTLKVERKTFNKAIEKYATYKYKKDNEFSQITPKEAATIDQQVLISPPNEDEIEEMIKNVIDMFPHLGDGFILACLEAYNYNTSDVIAAILEENLPPQIIEIPFDQIRIPPEPEPEQPILAYKNHKPDYDDALKLLNDKRDMKQIKTFILDGIQYINEYDMYEDEYDDRADEETVKVADHGSEDILTYNPNYEDAVSDTSYSEDEYDDQGKAVVASKPVERGGKGGNKGNFCEDPAALREKREARRRSQGKSFDVVGKTKGQGQDKNVLKNRDKKSVNKSSRANHSRKSGAQWKRNKGMLPS